MAQPQKETEFALQRVYQQTSADYLSLKSMFPEDAVRSLAQEALLRLSRRVSAPVSRTEAVVKLSKALIGRDASEAGDQIEHLQASGVDDHALYLAYLAPAARQLGEWWETDDVTFAEVTLGTGRIYGIMRGLGRRMRAPSRPDNKSAMIATVPDDIHTLGAKMATDLLRKQGWLIELVMDAPHEGIMTRIHDGQHLIIGFSAGGQHALPALARLVVGTRLTQPYASILISGNIVQEAGDRIKLMGVDGMSQTFAGASELMDQMWATATD